MRIEDKLRNVAKDLGSTLTGLAKQKGGEGPVEEAQKVTGGAGRAVSTGNRGSGSLRLPSGSRTARP